MDSGKGGGGGPGNVNYAYTVRKVIYSCGFHDGTTLDARATSSASVIPDACHPDKMILRPFSDFRKLYTLPIVTACNGFSVDSFKSMSIVVISILGSSSMAFMIQEVK